jgi:outer membrane receptor protein involved in Fe transport
MKHLYVYITLFLCFLANIVLAQNNSSIRGKLLDNASAPVEFANVLLFAESDTIKLLKGAISDGTGNFIVENIILGNYFLKIQLIGYKSKTIQVSIKTTNEKIELGNIILITDTKLLQSVEVTAKKDIVQKTAQGMIINASATLTQVGGTATDLLRNTPTVVVDGDGAITLRGKTPLIWINGRNSNLSNTDQIPASSIESIEIINNPSAKYDADAEGGIINIKLKKSQEDGMNGAVAVGIGRGAAGRINSSVLLNNKVSKWNIGLAYDNRFANRTRKVDGDRINFALPNEYYITQRRADELVERNQNLRLNIDYTINTKNTLSFEAIGILADNDNNEFLKNLIEKQNLSFTNQYTRRSLEIRKGRGVDFALVYKRKFADPRKTLSTNVSSSLNSNREDTDINTQALLENNNLTGNPFLQRTYNYQNTNVSNLQVDYAQPLSEKSILEIGYKGILRTLDTDFQSQSKTNEMYISNPKASNIFDYREQIHAAYGQYKSYLGDKESPKLKYEIGLRAEQVWNNGKGASNNVNVSNQYFNLFPTANFAYYPRQNEFIKLTYSRRINRPGLGQLNPFTDITDSLTQRSGNPALKPELVHSVELGYSKDWDKISFSTNAFYRYASNIIQPFTILRSDGVLFIQPQNFGNSQTYGLENILTAYITKSWDTNISFSLFQQNINGNNVSAALSNSVFSWYGKIITNFALWKGSKLQLIGIYNSPIATPQGTRIAIYNVDLGFQQKIISGKGRLGLVITDVFNTQKNGNVWNTQDFNFSRISKVDTRAILLTFAYTFGTSFKEKLMENKFSND